MAYHLEGRLLEVCNCRVLCPCWKHKALGIDLDIKGYNALQSVFKFQA